MSNQIFTIKPYLWNGIWVFDDPSVGLVKEALVAGMPEIITAATKSLEIKDPERGFIAMFSKEPFYESQITMTWQREVDGGNVYKWENAGLEGWLCPALFQYFDDTPKNLYVCIKSIQHSDAWKLKETESDLHHLIDIVGPLHLKVCPQVAQSKLEKPIAEAVLRVLNQHWHEVEDEVQQAIALQELSDQDQKGRIKIKRTVCGHQTTVMKASTPAIHHEH